MTIVIANAMGWVDVGEFIENIKHFGCKMALAGVFIVLVAIKNIAFLLTTTEN